MAVRFKVPASPKKSIFAIDEFLGVDLTNTGTSIDEVRSPNAENMVRWTPGKVRKRTGYKTKMLFSDSTDVNRAAETSDEWVELFTDNKEPAVFDIYGDPIMDMFICMKYDCLGTYSLGYTFNDGTEFYMENVSPSSFYYPVWAMTNYNYAEHGGVVQFKIKPLLSNPDDAYFRISSLRMCKATAAADYNEWMEMPWTPAPEDVDIIFSDTGVKDSAIYGVHQLKTGTITGSRIVNVNRVLGTSDDFQTFSVTQTYKEAYDLGENFYKDSVTNRSAYADGMDIYVTFDYISDNDVVMRIDGCTYTDYSDLHNTNGEIEHKEFNVKCGEYGALSEIALKTLRKNETATVQIKNMSIVYEKDDDYAWSPAPEDLGQTFPIEDIYKIESKNYARISDYTETKTAPSSGVVDIQASICTNTAAFRGHFCYISFDLTAGTQTWVDAIDVRILDNDKDVVEYIGFDSDINGKHFSIIASGNDINHYARYISVLFTTDDDADCSVNISNITVNKLTPKTDYGISPKTYLYHVDGRFYTRKSNSKNCTLAYNNANKQRSQSWQIDDKLILIDGKNIYHYTEQDGIRPFGSTSAYTPLITISKSPSGGGVPYEPFNLLQPKFIEQFTVDHASASATDFQLSFGGLDSNIVTAWVLNNNGEWKQKVENIGFTVNRATGVVSFTDPPGESPISGEDNVRIQAYKTIPGYADRIKKCSFGTLYGVGGEADRLFLSGNPNYPNWDFYSEQNDPSYFPDTGYSVLGSKAGAIVGYAMVNNYLATFKDEFDTERSVYIRQGELIKNEATNIVEPVFRIVNTLQGNGVVARYAFGNLQTEPLFLTRQGVYAITPQDITGDKYSQNRSFYLDGALTQEEGLENAIATVFNDQYILAINNKFYILDGLQATRTDRSEPYSTRQYVGFFCTNIPAFSMWVDEQALWIGTTDGKICRFENDIEDPASYSDDGKAIYCCWETPDLDGKIFYKNKTFRYFAIRIKSSWRTSYKLFAEKLGNWTFIKEDRGTGTYFDFFHIDFDRFSFSTDRSNRVGHSKIRIKKVDKARFRVENGEINELFGLVDLALEYIESGNYKG